MAEYALIREAGKVVSVSRDLGNGLTESIPLDPRNASFQTFLSWNASQNPPLNLADEVYVPPTSAEIQALTRPHAKAFINRIGEPLALLFRAFASILVDELNDIRTQTVRIGTFAYDPPSLANGAGVTKNDIGATGAAFLDVVHVTAPYSLQGITLNAYVHAADTLGIRLQNSTGGAINLGSGTWGYEVRRPINLPARTLVQARAAIATKLDGTSVDF